MTVAAEIPEGRRIKISNQLDKGLRPNYLAHINLWRYFSARDKTIHRGPVSFGMWASWLVFHLGWRINTSSDPPAGRITKHCR